MRPERNIDVALGFTLRVEGDVDPKVVGQQFSLLIQTPGQIGNPDWIATPTHVTFLMATERAEGAELLPRRDIEEEA